MKTTNILILFFTLLSLTIFSCGDDPDDGVQLNSQCADAAEQLIDFASNYTTALTAWSGDPTDSVKCEAFKIAGQEYVDELEDYIDDCRQYILESAGNLSDIESSIESTRKSINDIGCS